MLFSRCSPPTPKPPSPFCLHGAACSGPFPRTESYNVWAFSTQHGASRAAARTGSSPRLSSVYLPGRLPSPESGGRGRAPNSASPLLPSDLLPGLPGPRPDCKPEARLLRTRPVGGSLRGRRRGARSAESGPGETGLGPSPERTAGVRRAWPAAVPPDWGPRPVRPTPAAPHSLCPGLTPGAHRGPLHVTEERAA